MRRLNAVIQRFNINANSENISTRFERKTCILFHSDMKHYTYLGIQSYPNCNVIPLWYLDGCYWRISRHLDVPLPRAPRYLYTKPWPTLEKMHAYLTRIRLSSSNESMNTYLSLAKTGYWLGVCHGCYHFHLLSRALMHANQAGLTKFLPTVWFGLRWNLSIIIYFVRKHSDNIVTFKSRYIFKLELKFYIFSSFLRIFKNKCHCRLCAYSLPSNTYNRNYGVTHVTRKWKVPGMKPSAGKTFSFMILVCLVYLMLNTANTN